MFVKQVYLNKYSKSAIMTGSITVEHDNGSTHEIKISADDMPEVLKAIGKALIRAAADNAAMLESAVRNDVNCLLLESTPEPVPTTEAQGLPF